MVNDQMLLTLMIPGCEGANSEPSSWGNGEKTQWNRQDRLAGDRFGSDTNVMNKDASEAHIRARDQETLG